MADGVAGKIPCRGCEREFVPEDWRGRYCSADCRAAARRIRARVSKHGTLGTSRAWSRANRGLRHESNLRWRAANRQRVRDYERLRGFRRYGVSPEWFRDQLVGQAARCAICGNVFASQRDTHIDHDHESGKVRALLCSRCNTMLGLAHESAAVLETAIRYLGAG